MTNGDRIRQMSNEELAKNIYKGNRSILNYCQHCAFDDTIDCVEGACIEGIKAYLESEEE